MVWDYGSPLQTGSKLLGRYALYVSHLAAFQLLIRLTDLADTSVVQGF